MTDAERIASEVADRIRDLIAGAEERAAAIVREAEDDAQRIRERAEAEANRHLAELRRALAEIEGRLDHGPSSEVDPGPAIVPEPTPDPGPAPTPDPGPDPGPAPVPEPTPERIPEPTPERIPEPSPERIPEPVPPPDEGTPPSPDPDDSAGSGVPEHANGARSTDAVAARLVAMNLALGGSTRDEIDAALAADYDLDDRAALIDEVLAKVGN